MGLILHEFRRVLFRAFTHDESIYEDAANIADCDQASEQYPHCRCSHADKYAHEVEHQYFYRNKEQEENGKTEYKSFFLHEVRKEREHKANRSPCT